MARITLRSWSKPRRRYNLGEQQKRPPFNSTEKFLVSSSSIECSSNSGHSTVLSEEDAPIRIPETLDNDNVHRSTNEDLFSLEVSSIVLSTNNFGDFSQCTIISELLDHGSQKLLGEQCKDLWEKFIHQPQAARCLVFLTILGQLCQHMADDYRNAMDYLIQTLKIEVSKRPT